MKGNILSESVLFLFFISFNLSAQQLTRQLTDASSVQVIDSGVIINTVYKNGILVDSVKTDMNEYINVIVRLNEKPISAIYNKSLKNKTMSGVSAYESKIDNEHLKFKRDIHDIEKYTLLNKAYKISQIQVQQEYKVAINGFMVKAKRWMIEEIKKLSYVKSVNIDREVKMCDDESNHIIGSDSAVIKLGYNGKGIRIGIIDTGIDYMHPDLGGGFGPAFKVKGGYDCINNDPDPLDDNGHGTHVAGIAAANGTLLKGVAPEAELYAYKVLNGAGLGTTSSVIEGIERAIDPDNNPATNDALDIINLSLSSNVYGNDPLSESINNATSAGIVCVVAAGNSGSQYNTIGTPGCVESAITVAASDKYDKIAGFSSRGPSQLYYGMKPDITAPGVAITSDINGGGYEVMDGTSMAAPHIAGCAALILQKHPDWNPLKVKSILMQTAKNIGYDIYTQGSGRVNIYKALTTEVLFSPVVVDLGMADVEKSTYSISDTIRIYNMSAVPKYYSLKKNNIPSGMGIIITPESVNIPPFESKEIVIATTINNNLIPNSSNNPPAYQGVITALSNEDTVSIPYALIKSPVINIKYDEAPRIIYIFNNKGSYYSMFDPEKDIMRFLPSGNYDILTLFSDNESIVIKENIDINSITNLNISKSEAKNKIQVTGLDENGNALKVLVGYYLFSHKPSTFEFYTSGAIPMKMNLSDFGPQYLWEQQSCSYNDPEKFYSFNAFLKDGCNSDRTFINDPQKFKHIVNDIKFPPGIDSLAQLYIYAHTTIIGDFFPITAPVRQNIYLSPLPYKGFGENHIYGSPYFFQIFYPYKTPFNIYSAQAILHTSMLLTPASEVSEVWQYSYSTPVDIIIDTNYTSGFMSPHWTGRLSNNSSIISLTGNMDNEVFPVGSRTNYFYFPMKDWTPLPDQKFVLRNTASIIDSGKIYEKNLINIPAAADQYVFESEMDKYYVTGKQGKASVNLEFDTRKQDSNSPYMTYLKILADNKVTDQLEHSQNGEIIFGFADDKGINSTGLYYHSENDTVWRNMPYISKGTYLSAKIPAKIPDEYISLRFTASDLSGNKLDYVLEPAYKVVGPNISPSNLKLNNNIAVEDSMYLAKVTAYDPENDQLTFSLDNNNDWLKIDSLTGEIAGIPRKQQVGEISVKVRVVDDKGGSASGVYSLIVKHINHAPVINNIADTTAYEDQPFSLAVKASDYDNDTLVYKAVLIPSWATIDSAKGAIKGMPGYADIGPHNFKINVDDQYGGTASVSFKINVCHLNHIPLGVKLFSPGNKDTVNMLSPTAPVLFKWSSAIDKDLKDTLKYAFKLSGISTDTLITGIKDTSISLDIMRFLSLKSEYTWAVSVSDGIINVASVDTFMFVTSDKITGINDNDKIPSEYYLQQNYPNPFNPQTIICYGVPKESYVKIILYNVLGKEVLTLVNEEKLPGKYNVVLDRKDLSSGVYFYTIKAGEFISTKKLILLK